MDKNMIGTNAGIVYNLLSDQKHWNYEELKRESHMTDVDLCTAIGWLARENNIEFEDTQEGVKVFLNINYYF